MNEEQLFYKDLIKNLCGVDFFVIENSEKAFTEYLRMSGNDRILQLLGVRSSLRGKSQPLHSGIIYEFYIISGSLCLVFYDENTNRFLLLGPVLTEEYVYEDTLMQLIDNGISNYVIHQFEEWIQSLSVISTQSMYKTMHLLLQHTFGQMPPFPIERIDYGLNLRSRLIFHPSEHDEDVIRMREIERRYEISTALTEAVKEGNFSLASYFLGKFHFGKDNYSRNANPLRNLQNYCIILNTQLRYALEEQGIHPYLLDAFSSDIALHIEQLQNVNQAKSFVLHVIREYCKLVQNHAYPNLKPMIHLAVTYIKEHLNDNLTVKDTAQALTMNANYLSSQFHEQMGVNFIEFVNQERIKQASGLLRHTNLPIKDIASLVGYNNTSYFSKQFFLIYHQSPRAYRSGTRNHQITPV